MTQLHYFCVNSFFLDIRVLDTLIVIKLKLGNLFATEYWLKSYGICKSLAYSNLINLEFQLSNNANKNIL